MGPRFRGDDGDGALALQNKPAQIGVLGEVADVLLHVIGIDLDGLAMTVRRGERNLVEHALHHRLQPPRTDILHRRIDGDRDVRQRVDGIVGDVERDAFGLQQRDILLDQRCFRLGQDAAHVVARQR